MGQTGWESIGQIDSIHLYQWKHSTRTIPGKATSPEGQAWSEALRVCLSQTPQKFHMGVGGSPAAHRNLYSLLGGRERKGRRGSGGERVEYCPNWFRYCISSLCVVCTYVYVSLHNVCAHICKWLWVHVYVKACNMYDSIGRYFDVRHFP